LLQLAPLELVVVHVALAVGGQLDFRAGRRGLGPAQLGDDVHGPAADERDDQEAAELLLRVDRGDDGHQAQWGPSCSWPVVLVPMGGPWTTCLVSTTRTPPSTSTAKRSRPRGAGPPFFSPTR